MSKKRGRPPKEELENTVRVEEKKLVIPDAPRYVVALSHIPQKRWGVPLWLVHLAAYTGSEYGKKMPGTNNAFGIKAKGTEAKNAEGWAWFGRIQFAYDRFGWICKNLDLDYSKPDKCVAALKSRCPNIDTVPYTHFTEA